MFLRIHGNYYSDYSFLKYFIMNTKKFIQKSGLAALAFGLLVLASCHKKDYDLTKLTTPDWNPSFAAPLAYSSVQLDNLITFPDTGDILMQEDSNHFMSLYYSTEIYSASVSDLLVLDDQQISASIGVNDTIVLACQLAQFLGYDTTFTLPAYSSSTQLAMPNGAEVDSIALNGGTLSWNISSDFQHDIIVDILITSATKNGVQFSQQIVLDYTGTTPVVYNQNIDLIYYPQEIFFYPNILAGYLHYLTLLQGASR